jgi:hypothetical protein
MAVDDINRIVNTIYKVTDLASAPMSMVLGVASRAASMATSPITMLFSVAGATAAVHQLAAVSSSYEDTINTIAGSFNALGVSSSFTQGLADARTTMDQISVAAALLPGEADDYIGVFRDGLPFVRQAVGGTIREMTQFTNSLTAIGSALRVPAQLIGRDISDMLAPGRGHASIAQTQVFKAMLPFMQQLRGQANLTSESFNAMTAPRRAQLLKDTFASLQPMLDNAAHSFNAMSGALISTGKMMGRLSGEPLFEELKTQMGAVNSIFFTAQGQMTEFGYKTVAVGKYAATYMAAAFRGVGESIVALPQIIGPLFDRINNGVKRVTPVIDMLTGAASRVITAGRAAIQGASVNPQQVALGGATAVGLAAGIPGLGVLLGAFTEVVQHTDAMNAVFGFVTYALQTGVSVFGRAWSVITTFETALGRVVAGVLPGLMGAGNWLISAFDHATGRIGPAISSFITASEPLFTAFGTALGNTASHLAMILTPAITQAADAAARFIVKAGGVVGDIHQWGTENLGANSYYGRASNATARTVAGGLGIAHAFTSRFADMLDESVTNTAHNVGEMLVGSANPFTRTVAPLRPFDDYLRHGVNEANILTGLRSRQTPGLALPGVPGVPAVPGAAQHSFLDDLNAAIQTSAREMREAAARSSAASTAPPPGRQPHPTTHNDFRGSRFDITQRFAEGFDPDRIAVAFVNDLERTANRRLTGGLEPLYGVPTS